MLVYGTSAYNDPYASGYKGGVKAAYDYRATVVAMRTKQQVAKCCPPFGEQVDLTEPTDKVTENFTGKEKDDETELNYFGARYLDPMLGLWTSVDAARQYQNPYLYAGNNPIMRVDPDGNQDDLTSQVLGMFMNDLKNNTVEAVKQTPDALAETAQKAAPVVGSAALMGVVLFAPEPVSKITTISLHIKDLVESETPGEFIGHL